MIVLAAVLLATGPLAARDHDAIRHAVETGEIRALTEILNDVRTKLPGEIVGVKVERDDGRWFYEFRTVDSKGQVFEVYVDAHSGKIERVKEK